MLFFLTACYTIVLATASLLPAGPQAPGGWDRFLSPSLQNFLHLPAYTVLTILVLSSAASRLSKKGTGSEPEAAERRENGCGKVPVPFFQPSRLALVAACILFGVLLEGLQAYIPGRFASATDMLTNAAGAGLGLIAWNAGGPVRRCVSTPASRPPETSDQRSKIRRTATDN